MATDGGDTVVTTQPVAVQLAFKGLHARVEASTFALDGARAPAPGVGVTQPKGKHSTGTQVGGGQHLDWQVFDADGKRGTLDDQIDGTWLVGGLGFPGVIKLAEDGRLVWSKRLKLPRVLPGEVDDAEDDARSTLVAQAKNTNI